MNLKVLYKEGHYHYILFTDGETEGQGGKWLGQAHAAGQQHSVLEYMTTKWYHLPM